MPGMQMERLAYTFEIEMCIRDSLRAAGVSSRNEFVEKAIECYAGWLDVKQNPEFFRELFGPDIGR